MQADYSMIFKRKSVRKFEKALSLSDNEMRAIEQQLTKLTPLDGDIPVAYRLVPSGQTTCKRGEYCLLCYCNHTRRALLNAGYLLEQMDLFLTSMDIGVCWHGIGKPDLAQWEGLPYTIMLAFGKSRPEDFRADVSKARRKPLGELWQGAFDEGTADAARYAPSACNMQPWRVQSEGSKIRVFRTTEVTSAIMPARRRPYFNTIDLGIFLCFLELSLTHHGFAFHRTLLDGPLENPVGEALIPIAVYTLSE